MTTEQIEAIQDTRDMLLEAIQEAGYSIEDLKLFGSSSIALYLPAAKLREVLTELRNFGFRKKKKKP